MKSLRIDAEKSPISNIIIAVLLAIGLSSFPTVWILSQFFEVSKTLSLYLSAITKIAFCVVFVYLIYSYDFNGLFRWKISKFYLVIPCFLVVINNFPFIAVITGEALITASTAKIIGYVLYSFSVALFEELAFRGLVFPLVYLKTKDKKKGLFIALVISSLIFGAVHIVNFFAGANIGGVLLQMCYSFLIGGMCSIALCITGGLIIPILLHFIFNFGGLFIETLGSGAIWNIPTIMITAILGVIVAIYMIIIALKLKEDNLKPLLKLQ